MNQFTKELEATRSQLEKLERLAVKAPDLLQYGQFGIYIQTDRVRVILSDSTKDSAYWFLLARKYHAASWKRDNEGSWNGELDGVRLTILNAEIKTSASELVPLDLEMETA